jgi:D-glutamate N-acetyltransferase
MSATTVVELRAPYLILIGDVKDSLNAKTGFGVVQWRRDLVAGQLRFPGCPVDLGVPDLDVQAAKAAGAASLVIGVAPVGGVIPDSWWEVIVEAAAAGLDIVCGLHLRLADYPAVVAAASASGARLIDVRVPPRKLPVGTGKKRSGRRVLMVGTDCAVGKKYSALALDEAMRKAGMKSTFRATGQTGIMIAGSGLPIDAVVSDFVSGAAELLSPDNEADHWDVVEGQGSLFHPGYAAVSLGLLHGSQPEAIVVCHEAGRTEIGEWEGYPLPGIAECIELNLAAGRLTNKAIRCVGVSVNTSGLPASERESWMQELSAETGLPCVDPLIDGMQAIVDEIRRHFP